MKTKLLQAMIRHYKATGEIDRTVVLEARLTVQDKVDIIFAFDKWLDENRLKKSVG